MDTSLYKLSSDYDYLANFLNNPDNADSNEMLEYLQENLDGINEKFDEKVLNIAIVINSLIAECETLESEISRLKKRYESRKKSIEWLKRYLLSNMSFCGKKKISSPTHTVSIRNTSGVEIINDKFIDWAKENNKSNLFITKIDHSPIKKLIKEELQNGSIECPYAKIVERQSVVIR